MRSSVSLDVSRRLALCCCIVFVQVLICLVLFGLILFCVTRVVSFCSAALCYVLRVALRRFRSLRVALFRRVAVVLFCFIVSRVV